MKNEEKNIDNLPPFLEDMQGKKEGYKVPFNYFENLENNLMDGIYKENRALEEIAQAPSLWQKIFRPQGVKYGLGMAAIMIGIVFWMQKEPVISDNLDGLTAESAETYIEDNIDEFSYDLITEELSDEDIANLGQEQDIIDTEDVPEDYWDEINDDNIEEYL